ncbi:MAG: DUF494 family protein [bacterium]|nr:DUF494 family protein [bacterium]
MTNRILEIVVLLIDYFRENQDHFSNIDDLSSNLKARGYTDSEISSAYSWLMDRYENAPEKHFSNFPDLSGSHRVFSEEERFQLTIESQGFLHKLLGLGLIDNEQFEAILERATMVSGSPLDLDQVKMVASTLIFRDIDELERFVSAEAIEENSQYYN